MRILHARRLNIRIHPALLGYCFGTHIASMETSTAEDCLRMCKQTAGCEWFTFHSTDGVCSLTADCQWVDETCGTSCVHGPKECTQEEDEGKKTRQIVMNSKLSILK